MTLNAKALEALLAERIGQDFEGECHLAEHEARQIMAALSSLPHAGVSETALEAVKHAIIISMQGYDYGREELDEDIGPVFRTTSQQIALIEQRAEIAAKRVIAVLSRQQEEAGRPCTCHPDDNPPNPCARRYALSECQQVEAVPVAWRWRGPNGGWIYDDEKPKGWHSEPVYTRPASPVPAGAGEPGVKALEWIEAAGLGGGRKLIAFDPFGNEFTRLDLKAQSVGEIEVFKAAAQADFAKAIRYALAPTTAPVSAPVVTPEMVAAAKDAYWHVVHHGEGYGDDCYEAAIEAAFEVAFARSTAVVEGK